jgi:hypothetical protein
MLEEEELKKFIEQQLRVQIQKELLIKRPSRGYDGRFKYSAQRGGVSDRYYTGNLFKSTTVEFVKDLDEGGVEIAISFPNAPEWYWVNYGRRGKKQNPALKYPPLGVILQWTRRRRGFVDFKGGDGKPMDEKTQAFLIQRSIGEYGTWGTDFIAEAIKKTRRKLERDLGQYAANYFENQLFKIANEK